jgi:hypothetical protein
VLLRREFDGARGGGPQAGGVAEGPQEIGAQQLLAPGVGGDVVLGEEQVGGGTATGQQLGPPAVLAAEVERLAREPHGARFGAYGGVRA